MDYDETNNNNNLISEILFEIFKHHDGNNLNTCQNIKVLK